MAKYHDMFSPEPSKFGCTHSTAYWVTKDGICPSNFNLKVIAECARPQTYTEIWDFLGLIGHYQRLIKGFTQIAWPLSDYLMGQGAGKRLDWVLVNEDVIKAFEVLKHACMTAPVLVFADYTKPFLLETDASKEGLEAMLSQKQVDRQYHTVTYGSQALTAHEKNYHSTKLAFLTLKWVVTEHFKEYLPYQPFAVRTDNNPLTYIMSTSNLDATGYWWASALERFNFELEYQKGHDNTVADVLSQITTWLDSETVKSILNRATIGATHWAEIDDPGVVEGDQHPWQEVQVTVSYPRVEMHMTDWAKAQKEDSLFNTVLEWLNAQKQTDLKVLLAGHAASKEGKQILQNCQNFVIHHGALYVYSTPLYET